MTLEELKQFIEANKNNQDVQSYLKGLYLQPEGVTAFWTLKMARNSYSPG